MEVNPIVLQLENGISVPVYVHNGNNDENIRIVLKSKLLEEPLQVNIPSDSADVLCVAANCTRDSEEFKMWLIDQIKADEEGEFYFGKTRFETKTLSSPRKKNNHNIPSQAAYSERELQSSMESILRCIHVEKCTYEKKMASNVKFLDEIGSGFKKVHELAAPIVEHDQYIQILFEGLKKVRQENTTLKQQLKTTIANVLQQQDRVESAVNEETKKLARVYGDENKALRQELRFMSLRVQEIHECQLEKVNLWKQVHAQQKAEIAFVKMECSKLHTTLDQIKLEKASQSVQIKDTLRLMNEAQARSSKQMNAIRGEMNYLRDIGTQQTSNMQNLTDLKDLYVNMMPKLERAYDVDRRSEAIRKLNDFQECNSANRITKQSSIRSPTSIDRTSTQKVGRSRSASPQKR